MIRGERRIPNPVLCRSGVEGEGEGEVEESASKEAISVSTTDADRLRHPWRIHG